MFRAAIAGAALLMTAMAGTASASLVLEPLTTFGSNGWVAPGTQTHPFLANDNSARGMAYHAASNRIYVASRTGGVGVHVLDATTGAHLHSLNMTGVTGGTFPVNMVAVGDDGAVYVGNLTVSSTDPFRIYRWANDNPATVPTAAFAASSGLARTGDTLAVIGSGADTRIIASGGGHAGIAVFDTSDGVTFAMTTNNTISGVGSGGFRLGLDFIDANSAIGQQTGNDDLNVANLTASTGTVHKVNVTGEGPLAYYGVDQLLATIDVTNSIVRLYDASDLTLLTSTGFQDMRTLVTANNANGNGTGDAAFGIGPDGQLRLYAMNTNNGIQAFVVIPEPAALSLLGLAGLGLMRRRNG